MAAARSVRLALSAVTTPPAPLVSSPGLTRCLHGPGDAHGLALLRRWTKSDGEKNPSARCHAPVGSPSPLRVLSEKVDIHFCPVYLPVSIRCLNNAPGNKHYKTQDVIRRHILISLKGLSIQRPGMESINSSKVESKS